MFSIDAYAFDIAGVFPPAAAFADFGALATVVVKVLIAVAGVLAFIFIIISGIKIVTSSGDEKKLESAKSTLVYAIIGIIVALLALVMVNLIQRILGSNIPLSTTPAP